MANCLPKCANRRRYKFVIQGVELGFDHVKFEESVRHPQGRQFW